MSLQCNTIICVDDEESILESYQQILVPEVEDDISEILSYGNELEEKELERGERTTEYTLLLAGSGEEAVEIVQREMAAGRRVAAGFFDMRMPGGIDGYQTIEGIRSLDPNILCAVVTAYTDRNVMQIRKLFTNEHQDELLYFKKPFAPEELEQTALNMVNSWNRKRKIEDHIRSIEKHKDGLAQILHAVSTLTRVPPHSLQHLGPGILFQLLGIVDGENGYAVFLGEAEEHNFEYGVGSYENQENLIEQMNADQNLEAAFNENSITFDENYCFLPLIVGENKLGGLYIETDSHITHFLDTAILNIFKSQMAQLVLNSLYHGEIIIKEQEVLTDPLTGLYNRRFFNQRFMEEVNRAVRFQHGISVLMVDIDDFKKINDTLGHEAGDQVLKSVGNILRLAVRNFDLIGQDVNKIGEIGQFAVRYGGEEFCLVLLETGEEGASIVGERVRRHIEEYEFKYKENTLRITASVGICSHSNFADGSIKDFLKYMTQHADIALYKAKKEGKNRVVFYDQGMENN